MERKLRVFPSSRVARLEVYRQEEGSDVMVLQNSERIDWTAGDTLGSLNFRLYDEGERLVSLPLKLTGKIKVWVLFDPFCLSYFIISCDILLILFLKHTFLYAVFNKYTEHTIRAVQLIEA